MEAMWTRFLPHIHAIRRLLAEGALGEVIAVHATHGQAFPPDPAHRLFARELGGGALLDLGVYPVSFASMVLGRPETITSLIAPAMTGVDGHVSAAFGYASGAHALLACTSLGRMPNSAAIVGTHALIEVDGPHFHAPSPFTLVTRSGERTRWDEPHEGSGLRNQADEVARCLAAGELESPLMPLDETVAIMETMDEVLAGHP
jgi:predicted dehydrogenase